MKHYIVIGEEIKEDGSNGQWLVEFDDSTKKFALWIRDAIEPWSDFAVPISMVDGKRIFAKTKGIIVSGKTKVKSKGESME